MNKEKEKHTITLMADYCADGLWYDGEAIDADYLKEDLDFPKKFIDKIKGLIERWQNMYEGYNLYTSGEETQKIYDSDDFKEFEKLGLEIFGIFRELDQDIKDKFNFEYFDERTSERIQL